MGQIRIRDPFYKQSRKCNGGGRHQKYKNQEDEAYLSGLIEARVWEVWAPGEACQQHVADVDQDVDQRSFHESQVHMQSSKERLHWRCPHAGLCSPSAQHAALDLITLAFTSVFVARSFEIDMHVREELNWY